MKSKNYFSSNLKFLRERKGLNQQQLAAEIGSNRSQVNAYENGQIKNPTVEIMLSVSDYFKLSLDILMKVDLTQLPEIKIKEYQSRSDGEMTGREMRVIVTTVNVNNKPAIAHVPVKAKAGYLAGYGSDEYIRTLQGYTLPFLSREKSYRSFQTEGDSMYPLPEKAIVIGEFVQDWFSLKNDVPCIVVTKDEGIVFKLVTNRINDERVLQLKSLNEIYNPYNVGIEHVCEIWKFNCYISSDIPPGTVTEDDLANSIKQMHGDIKKLLGAVKADTP